MSSHALSATADPSKLNRPAISLERMHALFNPRSIALIGATERSGWSWATFANLAPSRFAGEVHLVNPRGGLVHGQEAYARIADLPDDVDLAYVMVGPGAVLGVMEQIAAKGITSVVMLTSGFSEAGPEGAALEREVLEIALEHGITILGPNGNGYANFAGGVCPYGLAIPRVPAIGGIGFVLHSGGLASTVMDLAVARNVGVSLLTAMGNELTTTLTDVVRYLVHDKATAVIGMFVESIRDPEEFRAVAREALEAGKPLVAMKVGRSAAGARVASAHTGALAGDDAVIDAVFAQLGVVRVDSLEDLLSTTEVFASGFHLGGNRFGVVSSSGGANEIIADCMDAAGLALPDFDPRTEEALRAFLPDFANPRNPVDITGLSMVEDDLAERATAIIAQDPNIDGVLYWTDLPRERPADASANAANVDYYRRQVEAFRTVTVPVVPVGTAFTDITEYGAEVSAASGYPNGLGGISHGVAAVGRVVQWQTQREERLRALRAERTVRLLEVDAQPGASFGEYRAAELLRAQGVPMVPAALVSSATEAAEAAARFGFPVVVKLAADEVEHKSDIGGVKLHLNSADEVREAFDAVAAAGIQVGVPAPQALVQPMRAGGVELIVGVVRDPDWGLVMAVGLGGVWVEVFKDSVLHPLPTSRERVRQGLTELRAAALLDGVRGAEPADLDAITDAAMAVAEVAERLGDRLESLEINPLLVRGGSVEALDALITWR